MSKTTAINVSEIGPGASKEEWRRLVKDRLFDLVPCAIAVLDQDRRIVENNGYFKEIFGDGEGRYCYEVYKGRDSFCEECITAEAFKDGETHIHEEEGRDRYGCEAFYVVNATPARTDDGGIPCVIQMCNDVTDIRRRQREYTTFFECVPCVVAVLNKEMRVIRANDRFREAFGELNGYRCFEKLRRRAEPCEDCPVRNTFADGKIYQKKYGCFHKNGDEARYLVTSAPLSKEKPDSGYAVLMAMDVSESEELAADLAETAISREVIIEDSIDAIWGTDENGLITLINPAAEKLLGYPAREVIGKHPPVGMFPDKFMETIKENGDRCILPETTMTGRDGSEIPVRFVASAITRQRKLLGWSAFAQDLRQVKRLEKENIEAERLAAVGQTVAGVAHSVKNILSGLEGGMYVFKSGLDKGERDRINTGWEMIERNIGHITNLTQYLLDFARDREMKVEMVDIGEIIRETVDLYKRAAWEKDIELRSEVADGIDPLTMDRQGIHTCLTNLVTNALDACRATVKPLCRVTISCHEEDNVVIIEVADEGCGMDSEQKKNAFKRLFTTKSDKGTGLGLFMTRKIVQDHGGNIDMKSEPEKGTTFTLFFPRVNLPRIEK